MTSQSMSLGAIMLINFGFIFMLWINLMSTITYQWPSLLYMNFIFNSILQLKI